MDVALRPATGDDAGEMAAIYAPHVLAGTVSFETEAPDAAAMRERIAAADGLYPWIVATGAAGDTEAGDVLGYAYATQFSPREAYGWAVETTVYLADAAQRRGIGRRLYRALIDTLRAQGFTQAIARIALPNDASIALHEGIGFQCAGVLREIGWKHGRWIHVAYWQYPLGTPGAEPAALRRFADTGLVGLIASP